MSKTRVYELAKEFGMKGPEMAKLLRQLGFEKIKSHMAVLDSADEMLVVARLEAQGLQRRSAASTATAVPGRPKKKKALPKKALPSEGESVPEPEPEESAPAAEEETPAAAPSRKSLPPPVAKTPRKKTPEPEPGPEPEAPEAETPPPEAEPEPEPSEPTPAAAEEPPQAPPPAPEPTVAEAPPAATEEPPAAEKPEPEPPPAGEKPVEKPAEKAPAGETGPAEPAAKAEPPSTGEPPQKPGEGEKQKGDVKRLLVPKAKAQVLGRIELPQQVINDATRRSAPGGDRADADRNLRRRALQSTQGRQAGRPGGGRRGPSGGGLRDRSSRGPKPKKTSTSPLTSTVDPNKVVELEPPISVKALSEALGIKVNELVATLTFKLGVAGKTINSYLTPDEVELVALELKRKVKLVERKEAEEELLERFVEKSASEDEIDRAPVVTFMGHVDHGKTSILDALRRSTITKGEAGGITQHIGAYRVTNEKGHTVVVLDTPGHAAFTSMRARGASLTDVVVLVVAADDGVMPQTEEAINHAKAAGVPIVVAINKCDLRGANPMQVKQQLAIKDLQTEEWGGRTGVVEVSALNGQGLDDLIERIMLEAEILELKARPNAPGTGIIVESKQSPEQGVVVSVLVTDGTLRVRDQVLCGESYSRVRGLVNDRGEQVEEAGPSTPVEVLGLDRLPQPGDKLYVVTDTKKAKEVVETRQRRARDVQLAERSSAVTLENLSDALAQKNVQELKLILKADVMGSLEPLRRSLSDLDTEEVKVNLVHSGLGGISETDVSLAQASGAVIVGFNSVADQAARITADRAGVEIRHYEVIYELLDDVKAALEGLLAPEEVEKVLGHAEVRAVFKSSRFGAIAGCYMLDGIVKRGCKVRLSRDGRRITTTTVDSLRRMKDDVREVRSGYECGILLKNFNDIKEGDQLEFYEVNLVRRSL